MLNYKADNILNFSYKLNRMHKSALPNAIRFTLTDAAKDVKFKTLSKHANIQFDVKKASFFKAFSGYQSAVGWNIKKMRSKAGMIMGNNPNSRASTDIGKQQTTGIVTHKSYIASDNQRNSKGLIKKSYIDQVNIKPFSYSKADGESYVKIAIQAYKQNKPLLIKKNNKGYLVKIKSINKSRENSIENEIVASYSKGRSIKLTKKRPFLNNTAIESGSKIDSFYIKNAKRQFEKLKYK